ncbi:MAG TPA: iron-sulfur cluster assembly accessory protein [Wenzhouxiangella sp.]
MSTHMTIDDQIQPAITLTQAAADRIALFMGKEGGRGIHLAVRRTGCSGWAYELEIAKSPAGADEHVFHDQDIEIIITNQALEMMAGTVIDFVEDGLVREFRFKNPNVTAECGCGESFTIQS